MAKDPVDMGGAISDAQVAAVQRILGVPIYEPLPYQMAEVHLTEELLDARALAAAMLYRMSLDLSEAFERKAGVRVSRDSQGFQLQDLPELLDWIFNDSGTFWLLLEPVVPPRKNIIGPYDADRRPLTLWVELPQDGAFTFSRCCELIGLDPKAARSRIRDWIAQREKGALYEPLITPEIQGPAPWRVRQAEAWRRAGATEKTVRVLMREAVRPPLHSRHEQRWANLPLLFRVRQTR
ncbi:MAG TPA: hypothetical protein VMT61_02580 [Candidatus Binataceae bacterium]|nr:hypothetical protein [Candidatus Binataceae bacterium]